MNFDPSVLNDAQRDAMLDTEGYVLVLAGAGSGKTRVLTHRVAHLVLDKGVKPWNILAITFTNKATGEMKERLEGMLGEDSGVWVSTFHSLCATILRINAENLGYSGSFSIYDETDSVKTIKRALRELHLDSSAVKDSIKYHISKAKNAGMTPDEYFKDINGVVKYAEEIRDLYERYEELLKLSNAMDFDDLLHKTKELFVNHPEVLEKYQNKFHYIHVDEFQDTNKVQFELVEMLAKGHNNLFVVGDDDQSIYGWRGAEVKNILDFPTRFSGAKIHKLLQNYRSTTAILDTANRVIKHNVSRYDKSLFTERGQGAKVEYYSAYSDFEEAQWVIDKINQLKRYDGYTNNDFAILVRANSLTRNFENRLTECNIKFQIMGGFRFLERKEIQDVIAYLRLVANPSDNAAMERIINFPRRGIGDTTIENIMNYAESHQTDMFEVIQGIRTNGVLHGAAVNNVASFYELVSDLIGHKDLPLTEFVEYVVQKVGFEATYSASGKDDDANRFENIQEFVNQTKEFSVSHPAAKLTDYLETLSLVNENAEFDGEKVTIATMHSVKGLEFKVVFIVGCEEEVFPATQAKCDEDIEEERRVMYVAITRAQERLFITNANKRLRFGQIKFMMPSRFLAEASGMPAAQENPYGIYEKRRAYAERRGDRYVPDYGEDEGYERIPSYRPVESPKNSGMAMTAQKTEEKPQVRNKDTSGFVAGKSVKHPLYGEGKIILVTGTGAEATATVVFPKLGIKKFVISQASIKLV